jgi:hypothetical protein
LTIAMQKPAPSSADRCAGQRPAGREAS